MDVVRTDFTTHLSTKLTFGQRTVGKRSVTPVSLPGNDEEAEHQRRWTDPPSTVPTHFGTECSLETCHMCPTFPGCGDEKMKAGKVPALQNWAQPPMERRHEIAGSPIGMKGDWQQPPREAKREAYINPIVGGNVNVGVGPQCSLSTCALCPDFPGCESQRVDMTPKA